MSDENGFVAYYGKITISPCQNSDLTIALDLAAQFLSSILKSEGIWSRKMNWNGHQEILSIAHARIYILLFPYQIIDKLKIDDVLAQFLESCMESVYLHPIMMTWSGLHQVSM